MMSAPEGSFGSAARLAASSGVRDSAGAGFVGGPDSFSLGSDGWGLGGTILSSEGAISFGPCDAGASILVGVSAPHADKAQLAMTNPIAVGCLMS